MLAEPKLSAGAEKLTAGAGPGESSATKPVVLPAVVDFLVACNGLTVGKSGEVVDPVT